MKTTEQLKKVLSDYPASNPDAKELTRLSEFFKTMKTKGIARTKEYDIPQPDTIGRTIVERVKKVS